MRTRRIIALALVFTSLCGVSCKWLRTRNYNVDKPSPNGTYRVKFDVRVEEEGDLMGHFTEQGKIQFFKGEEVLYAHEWQWKDNWEATSIDKYPVVEWLGENVLRMGLERGKQPFMDEITVSNNSGERFKQLSVTYDGFESFEVLDVAPEDVIKLQASPEFQRSDLSNNDLWYSGTTQSGKEIWGQMGNERRRSPADGQLKFQITISPKDLKTPTKK
jgi:hypothetical protein